MGIINIHFAKTHLSRLVEEALGGAEIVIAKAGKPLVQLVPLRKPGTIRLGLMKGRIHMSDDFDARLPDSVMASVEGRS